MTAREKARREARKIIREWRRGECWLCFGGKVDADPGRQRSQLRGCLTEMARRAADAAGRLERIRLMGHEEAYPSAGEGYRQGLREDLWFSRAACAAFRYLLRRLPAVRTESQRTLFDRPDGASRQS